MASTESTMLSDKSNARREVRFTKAAEDVCESGREASFVQGHVMEIHVPDGTAFRRFFLRLNECSRSKPTRSSASTVMMSLFSTSRTCKLLLHCRRFPLPSGVKRRSPMLSSPASLTWMTRTLSHSRPNRRIRASMPCVSSLCKLLKACMGTMRSPGYSLNGKPSTSRCLPLLGDELDVSFMTMRRDGSKLKAV